MNCIRCNKSVDPENRDAHPPIETAEGPALPFAFVEHSGGELDLICYECLRLPEEEHMIMYVLARKTE